jgi:hypothetical protein
MYEHALKANYCSIYTLFFFSKAPRQDEIKANPFTQGPYGNSAFNPQKLGAKLSVSSFCFNCAI